MSGYEWHPIFRLTPTDGPVSEIDLRYGTELPPLRTRLRIDEEIRQRRDVNQVLRPLVRGLRWRVTFEWLVTGEMYDHDEIVKVVNALIDRTTTVELTLDGHYGDDAVYRECVFRGRSGPEPIQGKTHAGARYTLDVEGAALLSAETPIGDGRW
jgi:hypothetical protein